MKLINYRYRNEIRLGLYTEQGIIDLKKTAAKLQINLPQTIEDVMSQGLDSFKKIKNKYVEVVNQNEIEFLPAVIKPEKIICIGFNYRNHIDETKVTIPEVPIVFSKLPNTLNAHQQAIKLTNNMKQVDYEAELVVVIGKTCRDVKKDEALDYVFGYTCGNDFTDRYLQFKTSQWLIGKSLDGFGPIGPFLVTKDQINPDNLSITCRVNGEIVQSANTRDMIFDVPTIVSYLSQYMTLQPGDIIFTGTPGGVILGKPVHEQSWLKTGDEVEVTIEKIGTLKNKII